MNRIYWKIITNLPRHEVIRIIPQLINQHGIVLNSNLFSDYCLSLVAEVEVNDLIKLVAELNFYFTLEIPNLANFNLSKPIMIFISINFNQATGELKNIIPNVPS
jgi:hypothetical protein